jgi:hypothetical protein
MGDKFIKWALVIITAAVFVWIGVSHFTTHVWSGVVVDKVVKRGYGKEAQDTYLVFVKPDSGGDVIVLQNRDSLFRWKFNSSDIYGNLQVKSRYRITAYGWRFQPMSMYPNIVSAELVQ